VKKGGLSPAGRGRGPPAAPRPRARVCSRPQHRGLHATFSRRFPDLLHGMARAVSRSPRADRGVAGDGSILGNQPEPGRSACPVQPVRVWGWRGRPSVTLDREGWRRQSLGYGEPALCSRR
jgi:hypothetical protein